MSFKRIGNYMVIGFMGGLGLFNSSKLEIRQATDTNAELLFQNGQIISSAVICLCVAGMMAEILVMKNRRKKVLKSNPLITEDDKLSATEFYDKYAEDSPTVSKPKKYRKTHSKKSKPIFKGDKINSANDIGVSKKKTNKKNKGVKNE